MTEFQRWLRRAKPQETYIYHKGYLVCDREHRPEVDESAKLAYEAQLSGFVSLTQIRLGSRQYVYLAIRTKEIMG